MTRKQYESALMAGERARRAGKKRSECPNYGFSADGQSMTEAWQIGWDDEDARRKGV